MPRRFRDKSYRGRRVRSMSKISPAAATAIAGRYINAMEKRSLVPKVQMRDERLNRVSFIPPRKLSWMTYNVGWQQATGAVNFYGTAFRLDNIYDPDVYNVGKNKTFQSYTQMSYLYKNYKVIECRIKVRVINNTTTQQAIFAIGPCDSTSYTTDFATSKIASDVISREGIKHVVLAPAASSKDVGVLTYKCNPWTIIGMKKQTWMSDDSCGYAFGSTTINNPLGISPWLAVGAGNVVDSNATGFTTTQLLSLHYLVEFYNPIENTDS